MFEAQPFASVGGRVWAFVGWINTASSQAAATAVDHAECQRCGVLGRKCEGVHDRDAPWWCVRGRRGRGGGGGEVSIARALDGRADSTVPATLPAFLNFGPFGPSNK